MDAKGRIMVVPPTICRLPLETILRICKCLTSQERSNSTIRRDLVSVALTCPAFSEPAFDTLWHTIDTLAPLLRTLPEDLCTVAPFVSSSITSGAPSLRSVSELITSSVPPYVTQGRTSHARSQLAILRAPVPSDFVRFFTYSRRVKRLGIPRLGVLPGGNITEQYTLASRHRISFAVWDFLSAFGPRPLLPNLKFIYHKEWLGDIGVDWRKVPFHSAALLFGPKLRKVEVACVDPYLDFTYATEVIRNLSYIATSVEELSIEVDSNAYQLPIPKTGYLHGTEISFLGRLTSFSSRTVCVAPDTLIALGNLPFLESLVLRANAAEYPWDAMLYGRCSDLFPALLEVTLHETCVEWCTSFLRMVSSTSLRTLSICPGDHSPPPPAHFEALCVAIGSLPSAQSIVDLSITIVHSGYNSHGCGVYWSEDVAPLFALSAMQRLVISGGGCTTILDDVALEVLSQNCPDLVELVLGVRSRFRTEQYRMTDDDFPYVTPWGLLQLVRRCPRITKLALALDLRFSPASQTDPNLRLAWAPPVYLSGPEAPALKEFDATGSLLGDPICIASFFSLLFPQLHLIGNRTAQSRTWENMEHSRAWENMEHFRSCFAQVRAQERAWAKKEKMRLREPSSSEA